MSTAVLVAALAVAVASAVYGVTVAARRRSRRAEAVATHPLETAPPVVVHEPIPAEAAHAERPRPGRAVRPPRRWPLALLALPAGPFPRARGAHLLG